MYYRITTTTIIEQHSAWNWRDEPHLKSIPHPPQTTWRGVWQGQRWADMPGGDETAKKLNFALFRRGVYYELDDDKKERATRASQAAVAARQRKREQRLMGLN